MDPGHFHHNFSATWMAHGVYRRTILLLTVCAPAAQLRNTSQSSPTRQCQNRAILPKCLNICLAWLNYPGWFDECSLQFFADKNLTSLAAAAFSLRHLCHPFSERFPAAKRPCVVARLRTKAFPQTLGSPRVSSVTAMTTSSGTQRTGNVFLVNLLNRSSEWVELAGVPELLLGGLVRLGSSCARRRDKVALGKAGAARGSISNVYVHIHISYNHV